MLRELDIRNLKSKYTINSTGMIVVGSFVVKEYPLLKEAGFNNFVFIEANPDIIDSLRENVGEKPIILNELISDVDRKEYQFNISNHGQASSLLQFEKHAEYYPDLSKVVKQIPLQSITLDSLIKRESINTKDYNFLMMDVQGAELLVLRGFEQHLVDVDYIYTELNFDIMYTECVLESTLTEYLSVRGFTLVEFFNTGQGWGDGLYVRNTKLPK